MPASPPEGSVSPFPLLQLLTGRWEHKGHTWRYLLRLGPSPTAPKALLLDAPSLRALATRRFPPFVPPARGVLREAGFLKPRGCLPDEGTPAGRRWAQERLQELALLGAPASGSTFERRPRTP